MKSSSRASQRDEESQKLVKQRNDSQSSPTKSKAAQPQFKKELGCFRKIAIVLGLLFLTYVFLFIKYAPQEIPEMYQEQMVKPITDRRDYSSYMLDNGIQVLAISDESATTSAIALSIGAGSFMEPESIPGLAHYLEHVMFLKSKKYQKLNSLHKFVENSGGWVNAFTAPEETNYHLQIPEREFDKALDMVVSMFSEPVFEKKLIESEVSAVDGEYNIVLHKDEWRFDFMTKVAANPKTVYSRFVVGNSDSLLEKPKKKSIVVSKSLESFYNAYYTPELMTLVVLHNEPLDQLAQKIETGFGRFKPKEGDRNQNYDFTKPYTGPYGNKLVQFLPIGQNTKLYLVFNVDTSINYPVINPLNYLYVLLQYEGPGSLSSFLKQKGLILDLEAKPHARNALFELPSIQMTLTEEGLENIPEIMEATFAYIDLIKKKGTSRELFDQFSQITRYIFNYTQYEEDGMTKDVIDEVMVLASDLHHFPSIHLLGGDQLLHDYDEDIMKEFLGFINVDNLMVFVSDPNFKVGKPAEKPPVTEAKPKEPEADKLSEKNVPPPVVPGTDSSGKSPSTDKENVTPTEPAKGSDEKKPSGADSSEKPSPADENVVPQTTPAQPDEKTSSADSLEKSSSTDKPAGNDNTGAPQPTPAQIDEKTNSADLPTTDLLGISSSLTDKSTANESVASQTTPAANPEPNNEKPSSSFSSSQSQSQNQDTSTSNSQEPPQTTTAPVSNENKQSKPESNPHAGNTSKIPEVNDQNKKGEPQASQARMLIDISVGFSEAFELKELDKYEPLYNLNYTINPLPDTLLEYLHKVKFEDYESDLHLPQKNRYIPQNFKFAGSHECHDSKCIRQFAEDRENTITEIGYNNRYAAYYLLERSFGAPMTTCHIRLTTSELDHDVEYVASSGILGELIKINIASDLYEIDYAGNSVVLEPRDIKIEAFSEVFPKVMNKVLAEYQVKTVEPSSFEEAKAKYLTSLEKKMMDKPHRAAVEVLNKILMQNRFTQEEQWQSASELTFDDFKKISKNLFTSYHVETFLYGNLLLDDAKAYASKVVDFFGYSPVESHLDIHKPSVLNLWGTNSVYRTITPIIKGSNVLVLNYYQAGNSNARDWALLQTLVKILDPEAFAYLRTEQELGYIVKMADDLIGNVMGVRVLVMSSSFNVNEVDLEIEKFWPKAEKILDNLNDEKLAKIVKSFGESLNYGNKAFRLKEKELYDHIANQNYWFSLREDVQKVLPEITKADLIEYFGHLFKQPNKLSVQLISEDLKNVPSDVVESSQQFSGAQPKLFTNQSDLFEALKSSKPHA